MTFSSEHLEAKRDKAIVELKKASSADRNNDDNYINGLQRAFDVASKAGVPHGDSTYKSAADLLAKASQVFQVLFSQLCIFLFHDTVHSN